MVQLEEGGTWDRSQRLVNILQCTEGPSSAKNHAGPNVNGAEAEQPRAKEFTCSPRGGLRANPGGPGFRI